MPRPLRIEYPDAIYHVMNRGDHREDIFRDDDDRQRFVYALGESWPLGLSVQSGSNSWTYAPFPRLPTAYFQARALGLRLNAQIQPDGVLYVIGAAKTPQTSFPPQPPGFPLKPQPRTRASVSPHY